MFILNNYELNKLNHIEITLEKSIRSLVDKYEKNIPYFTAELKDFYENGEKLRIQEVICISENIQNVAKSLKSKINLLKDKQMSEIQDFEKFKSEMVHIQDHIINMIKFSKLELKKLTSLENDLNDELNMYYNGKVPEWSETQNISNVEYVPPRIKTKHFGQCKEVQKFFDFIHLSRGPENGWRKDDHLLFIKLREKHKKIDDLAFHLNEILPDISIEEIKSHEEWFKKFLNLQSEKKKAINRWKQNKDNDKPSRNTKIECKDNPSIPNMKEDLQLRDRLMQWKAVKEEKLIIDKELQKQRMLEKIEKERMKKQKQIEMKQIVNEWKETKIIFEQSQEHHQRIYQDLERKRRAANANKLIKQFQSMDELHILKMRRIHNKLTEEPKKRVQSGPPVHRDPRRLMQPTIQWAQRVKAIREPLSGPLPIFATPKLAIPEWRKNIM